MQYLTVDPEHWKGWHWSLLQCNILVENLGSLLSCSLTRKTLPNRVLDKVNPVMVTAHLNASMDQHFPWIQVQQEIHLTGLSSVSTVVHLSSWTSIHGVKCTYRIIWEFYMGFLFFFSWQGVRCHVALKWIARFPNWWW